MDIEAIKEELVRIENRLLELAESAEPEDAHTLKLAVQYLGIIREMIGYRED